jgi:antitoxin YefM
MMKTTTYSGLRRNFEAHLDQACADHEPLLVKRRAGKSVVLMSLTAYGGFRETLHLLGDPANSEHLMRSLKEAEEGKLIERKLKE